MKQTSQQKALGFLIPPLGTLVMDFLLVLYFLPRIQKLKWTGELLGWIIGSGLLYIHGWMISYMNNIKQWPDNDIRKERRLKFFSHSLTSIIGVKLLLYLGWVVLQLQWSQGTHPCWSMKDNVHIAQWIRSWTAESELWIGQPSSRVAQQKSAGPITQRSMDWNHPRFAAL